MGLGSLILLLVVFVLVLVFYFFVGCAYEFINKYLTYKDSVFQDDLAAKKSKSTVYTTHKNTPRSQQYELTNSNDVASVKASNDSLSKYSKFDKVIAVMLGIIGMCLQPLYILFYILVLISELSTGFLFYYFYFTSMSN